MPPYSSVRPSSSAHQFDYDDYDENGHAGEQGGVVEPDVAWKEYNIHNTEDDEINEYAYDLFYLEDPEDSEFVYDLVHPHDSTQKFQLHLTYQQDFTQSTGVTIWKGAEVMVDYLRRQGPHLFASHAPTDNSKAQVLELGAGVGLCSLAAHHLGADRVLATDGDVAALETLRRNVNRNRRGMHGPLLECPQLIWGHDRHVQAVRDMYGLCDVILAADVCYMSASMGPLFQTAYALLRDTGVLVLIHVSYSQFYRHDILATAAREGWTWKRAENEEDVYLLYKKKKATDNGW